MKINAKDILYIIYIICYIFTFYTFQIVLYTKSNVSYSYTVKYYRYNRINQKLRELEGMHTEVRYRDTKRLE